MSETAIEGSTVTVKVLVGVLTIVALAASGCGEMDQASRPPTSSQETADCGRVTVPGHQAVDIRAGGAGCDLAKAVAAAAEGRGREPYEAQGFACEPADASGGDTDYSCSRGDARIRFRYGSA